MKRKRHWRAWLIGAGAVLGVALVVGLIFREQIAAGFLKHSYLSQYHDADVRKHLPEFLEDRAVLSKYKIFDPSAGRNDAAKYFASLAKHGVLWLPDRVERKLKDPEWLKASINWDSFDPKFTWLTQLSSYDFWNPDPPFEARKKFVDLGTPDYTPYLMWAKLRLLASRERHDERLALHQVRHLARLIWTNDSGFSAMVTLAILGYETQFAEKYGYALEGDWRKVPSEDLARAKRYFWAMGHGLDPRVSDDIATTIAAPAVGRYLLPAQSTGNYCLGRDLLGHDFETPARRLDAIFAMNDGVCRPSILRRIWTDPAYPAWFNGDENVFAMSGHEREPASEGKFATLKDIQKSPDLARALGYVLLGISGPNAFSQYK
jgi:hypothetical protein